MLEDIATLSIYRLQLGRWGECVRDPVGLRLGAGGPGDGPAGGLQPHQDRGGSRQQHQETPQKLVTQERGFNERFIKDKTEQQESHWGCLHKRRWVFCCNISSQMTIQSDFTMHCLTLNWNFLNLKISPTNLTVGKHKQCDNLCPSPGLLRDTWHVTHFPLQWSSARWEGGSCPCPSCSLLPTPARPSSPPAPTSTPPASTSAWRRAATTTTATTTTRLDS